MPETAYIADPREKPLQWLPSRNFDTGGQAEVFVGHYGGVQPAIVPTATAATAFDLDAPNPQWFWTGTQWV